MKKIARIYLLYSNTKYYVGVTTQKVNIRLSKHISLHRRLPYKCSSSYVFESVNNPYDIKAKLLATILYSNKNDIFALEDKFIKKYKEKYGKDVVNNRRCKSYKRNCLTCGAQVNIDHFRCHTRTKKHKRNVILFRQRLKKMNEIITKT